MFEEDDAPGWDAIEGALEKICDPANRRHYPSRLHAVWAAMIIGRR